MTLLSLLSTHVSLCNRLKAVANVAFPLVWKRWHVMVTTPKKSKTLQLLWELTLLNQNGSWILYLWKREGWIVTSLGQYSTVSTRCLWSLQMTVLLIHEQLRLFLALLLKQSISAGQFHLGKPFLLRLLN